jgi:DNA-binding protein HU-beta
LAEGHDLPKNKAEGIAALSARMGRNPATGESIEIAASKKIAFRPAKELKDAV